MKVKASKTLKHKVTVVKPSVYNSICNHNSIMCKILSKVCEINDLNKASLTDHIGILEEEG